MLPPVGAVPYFGKITWGNGRQEEGGASYYWLLLITFSYYW